MKLGDLRQPPRAHLMLHGGRGVGLVGQRGGHSPVQAWRLRTTSDPRTPPGAQLLDAGRIATPDGMTGGNPVPLLWHKDCHRIKSGFDMSWTSRRRYVLYAAIKQGLLRRHKRPRIHMIPTFIRFDCKQAGLQLTERSGRWSRGHLGSEAVSVTLSGTSIDASKSNAEAA